MAQLRSLRLVVEPLETQFSQQNPGGGESPRPSSMQRDGLWWKVIFSSFGKWKMDQVLSAQITICAGQSYTHFRVLAEILIFRGSCAVFYRPRLRFLEQKLPHERILCVEQLMQRSIEDEPPLLQHQERRIRVGLALGQRNHAALSRVKAVRAQRESVL